MAHPRTSENTKSPTAISPGASERFHLVQRAGKPDAGKLEQLGPPCDPFQDGLQRRPAAGAVGLAEHDIIRAQLARDHGIVPGCEPSAASDTIWLEAGKRSLERIHPVEMGTVGGPSAVLWPVSM